MKPKEYCKKVSFATEAGANADIIKIKNKSNRKTIPIRAYHCWKCNGWHLTSKKLLPPTQKCL